MNIKAIRTAHGYVAAWQVFRANGVFSSFQPAEVERAHYHAALLRGDISPKISRPPEKGDAA